MNEKDEIGVSMKFRVNDVDIFCKGANWIPMDAMPGRFSEKRYRQLLGDVQSTQRLVEPQRLVDEEQEVFGQDLPLEQVLPRHAFDAVVVLRRRHSESQRG